ncbi:hypothetical protein MAPG_06021 [Magnaporthiopsis poae ATCC 64411]|uniref:Uncharacterized protein n=1 Tax=Magnaporthiopsis poae (strain ATCC 64411 / 73-15) TaxID=644358 RepID=A0A0C4E0X9_MAGP6|nr:hypothetical protein MAPG_06021 [Magnaporthiopsis poae ATCC 64411]
MATNIGPLTAPFTPLAGCLEQIYGTASTETRGTATTGHKWHILGGTSAGNCYPQSFVAGPTAFYSPGICPSGWTMASTTAEVVQTLTESRAVYCPSGYRYNPAPSSESSLASLPYHSSPQWPTAVTLRVPDVENLRSIQTTLTDVMIEVHATPIYIRFAQSQSATSTSTSTSSTSPAQTSLQGSAGGNNNNGMAAADEGLSVGAKAGIGAGVGAAVLGAALGAEQQPQATTRTKTNGAGAEAGDQLVGDVHDYSQNGQVAVEKDWDGPDPPVPQLDDTARAQAEMQGQGVGMVSPDNWSSNPTPPYHVRNLAARRHPAGAEMITSSNTHEMQARELPRELP